MDRIQRYIFSCRLEKFDGTKNDFCRKLGLFVTNASKFCRQLCVMTKGTITTHSTIEKATQIQSSCSSSALCSTNSSLQAQTQKRRSSDSDSGVSKKKKVNSFQAEHNRLREEIPVYQIGT